MQRQISDDDSEFEVMHVQGTNTFNELAVQTKYFNTIMPDFMPKAPFYAELHSQLQLGAVPLAPSSRVHYLLKLEDIMDEALLELYTDAGVTLFRNIDCQITVVFPQINSTFYGAMSYKLLEGDYFDSVLTKVHEGYEMSLNRETTDQEPEIHILADMSATLQQNILKLDMNWNNLKIPRALAADFPDGTRVYANILVKLTLIPTMPLSVAPTNAQLDAIKEMVSKHAVLYKPTNNEDVKENMLNDHKIPMVTKLI